MNVILKNDENIDKNHHKHRIRKKLENLIL